jgi:hypothetical protein
VEASSQNLHPETGARFSFDQDGDGYAVVIYLPAGLRWSGRLSWINGVATLEADDGQPSPATEPLAWAHAEALKLARTLRRTPKQHMLRWRSSPAA